MRNSGPVLAVALLAVLAGCATVSTETTTTTLAETESFEVEVTGNSSSTYVASAELVADPFWNVTVTYANGTNRTVAVPDRRGAVTFGPESGATRVEPGGEVVGGVYFEGSPEFSVRDDDVPPAGNAVYTVRRKGEAVLVAWGIARCGGHVSGLSLRVEESGVEGIGFACES